MRIAAIILAAGSGQRMGGPKALLEIEGETLLQRSARIAEAAGCAPILAIIGPWDPGTLDTSLQLVHNHEAMEGMSSSLRAGISNLPESVEAALILTVDQPAVDATLLRRLLALAADDPTRPAACAYGGSIGVPAVFPRRFFGDLLALHGDRGAKAILQRERTAALPFSGGETDLDTPSDLEAFRR